MDIKFEWDEFKNRTNRQKHEIWFEEVKSIFENPHHRYFADNDHSDDGPRFIDLGYSSSSRILVVVHCYKADDETIRIISARKATKKEKKYYEEGV